MRSSNGYIFDEVGYLRFGSVYTRTSEDAADFEKEVAAVESEQVDEFAPGVNTRSGVSSGVASILVYKLGPTPLRSD